MSPCAPPASCLPLNSLTRGCSSPMYFLANDRATSLGSLLQYGTGGQMTCGSITPAGTFPAGDAQPSPAFAPTGAAGPGGVSLPQPPSAMTLTEDEDQGSAPHPPTLRGRPTSVLDLARQTRSRCEAEAAVRALPRLR